jgi:hypothetical protein
MTDAGAHAARKPLADVTEEEFLRDLVRDALERAMGARDW